MGKNYIERSRRYWLKLCADAVLLALCFLAILFLRRGNLVIDYQLRRFLPWFFGFWIVVTLFSRKFKTTPVVSYFERLKLFWQTPLFIAFLITLLIYLKGWFFISRYIVYGSLFLYLVLNMLIFTFYFLIYRRRQGTPVISFQVFFFVFEFVAIIGSFFLLYLYKKSTLALREDYQLALLAIYAIWLMASLILHRFRIRENVSMARSFLPFWQSEILIVGGVTFILYATNFVVFSRLVILGSLLTFSILENLIVFFYLLSRKKRENDETETRLVSVQELDYPEEFDEDDTLEVRREKYFPLQTFITSSFLQEKLKKVYLSKFDQLYHFIEENLELNRFDILQSFFIFSSHPYNVEILGDETLTFFLNLEKLNNIRRINQYLFHVNQKLQTGGIYIGKFQTQEQRWQQIRKILPQPLASLVGFFDFLFRRVAPKLPLVNKVYFALSRGRNRILSKTECLGRLYCSGFEIHTMQSIENHYFFIARKVKPPQAESNHAYGLIFKQRRLGKTGKIIFIYKIRTMHPYAEYLHKYIYERHQLDDAGKIKGDFRITSWGRFFRKTWIDELPMLINLLKGDLKLVGVRPLSETFFATYPDDLKQERLMFKPGLIPPFYADLPQGIEEVWDSERRYLEMYQKHPMRTDFSYFFKALNNILFHHAKSS